MSPQTIRFITAAALLLHGIAHAVALGALVAQSLGHSSASRLLVRSWLFSSQASTAARLALIFWLPSTIGFIASGMSLLGILIPEQAWRQLAVFSAVVSILGIVIFLGVWPGSQNRAQSLLNTAIALVVDIAILASQLWLHWSP